MLTLTITNEPKASRKIVEFCLMRYDPMTRRINGLNTYNGMPGVKA